MPTVSIIVPIYNAAKTLPRCINSILTQTYADFELLLINDGSSDESGSLCEQYAQKDPRIKLYHKQNEGVGSARQKGIEQASGVYSIHVDSDDYIEQTALETVVNVAQATNADVVTSDYFNINSSGTLTYVSQKPLSRNPFEYLRLILEGKRMGVLWNKLIKHTLYTDNAICINKDIKYCEDVLALVQLLQKARSIAHAGIATYYYCNNANSITRSPTREHIESRIKFIKHAELLVPTKSYLVRHKIGVKIEMLRSNIYSRKEFMGYEPRISLSTVAKCGSIKIFILYSIYSSPFGIFLQPLLKARSTIKKTIASTINYIKHDPAMYP